MKSIVVDARTCFFGALAGIGLALAIPAREADKRRARIGDKARVVMEMALKEREGELAPGRTTEEMVASLRTYKARYGPIESYEGIEAYQPFYGAPQILGRVKRNQTWFSFRYQRSPDGRGYGYEETFTTFPE